MGIKLRELKVEARNLARAGQPVLALAAHEHMLAENPLDGDSRRKIADLLVEVGDRAGAAEVYRTVAMHDIRSGHLPPAIVACKVLASLGQKVDDLVGAMAAGYAHGARTLAKFAARQAPVDLDAELAPLDPSAAADPAAVAGRARARALDLSAFVQYPEQYLPVPFFSELPRKLFPAAIEMARLLRGGDGDLVIKEGEPGKAFYFVATGEVRVFARAPNRAETIERARLHEGSLFGEMALYSEQPRTASVSIVGEADLLEIGRDAVTRLCAEVPALSERIDKFARERVLKNLLSFSPLFKPFDHKQQMELMKRFEGHQVDAGTVLIREGQAGQGLFVILLGEVEVTKHDGAGDRQLARLGPGELFGEMSLLADTPTTATVRALSATTILFLGRQYFQRLVAAIPTMRAYFENLSRSRAAAPNDPFEKL
jgi:cAMP-dependent protein kinase regulator